ncbi:peroxiredoxin [Cognatiluteimonas lumbrici]|uniref:peroxiredoxin n=1 Tax=Cognatiluteimonas lumbrici TaxID=2559601 RepID=UPI001125F020|nr:peroxiredoxin [Luteimonas lumbrici]
MNPLPKLAACGVALSILLAAPALAALKPGDKAPTFTAPAYLAGNPFTYDLATALESGPVVLYFFPAAHTPGCNLEAHLFSEAVDEFASHGASVIGITAGNTDELAEFSAETEHCGGKFPVAADQGAKIAAQYDAVLEQKPEWSSRTSYVITTDGRIAAVHSEMNPNQHVRAMLDAVAALGERSAQSP